MEKLNSFIVNQLVPAANNDINVYNAGYERTSAHKGHRILDDFGGYSMHYVLSGAGYLKIAGKTHRVTKDHIFFLFPKTSLEYYPDPKTAWKYCWMDFVGTKVGYYLTKLSVSPDRPVIPVMSGKIGRLFLKNVTDCMHYPSISDTIATSSFYNIISELLKLGSAQPANKMPENIAENYVNQALQYMFENHGNAQMSLNMVSSYVGITEEYLARLFKKFTNLTYTDHLSRIRINAALKRMNDGETVIKNISAAVGFKDVYYFSNVFKAHNGISPREHLKTIRAKAAEPKND